ncbi:hypothetical protein [Paraflavitalea sp. CAU 1676]|uniref:hypothetical protein n=1 Tax=Paraflavitalea sp. CAU 1676 TaxID=3032598 RepID=UPI0023DADB2B|nr:hypothetical protein [Paraflavitalea sp. CAU 1676]MDF2188317.1 hypothetical protein [Paraflavitalea sp. CAU 1676]
MSTFYPVKVENVKYTDEYDGIVTLLFPSGDTIDACFWGATFDIGDDVDVVFDGGETNFSWENTFSRNKDHQTGMHKASERAAYHCYGKITGVNPVMADFGLMTLKLGDWTHDEQVIGEYIYWEIGCLVAFKRVT